MKTKTYVLTLSTNFPKGHPREGEETGFAEKVKWAIDWYGINGRNNDVEKKIHTIRANYDLWKQRIDEVNKGLAVLSVREWLGAPRRSKQREIFRFDKDSGIGVEAIVLQDFYECHNCVVSKQDHYGIWKSGITVDAETIAENDGLSEEDWLAWFSNPRYDLSKPMAIIHFTKFRYCK